MNMVLCLLWRERLKIWAWAVWGWDEIAYFSFLLGIGWLIKVAVGLSRAWEPFWTTRRGEEVGAAYLWDVTGTDEWSSP